MRKLERYIPVLRTGLFLWTVGTGLKPLFNRSTSPTISLIILVVEDIGVGMVHQPGLLAVQALASTPDRAVATSTRNLLRSLGAASGVAISTAILRGAMPDPVPEEDSQAPDARMKAFHVVFITLVPLMGLCFLGNFFVSDTVLLGDDESQQKDREQAETAAEKA